MISPATSKGTHTMRLEAYLGGFAIQIGERFILDLDLQRFYGRLPWGRGGWEWYIDFTGRIGSCWDRIDRYPRPDS